MLGLKSGLVFLFRHPKCHSLAFENGHFWQNGQNGSKWSKIMKIGQNGQNSQNGQNGPKRIEIVKNGQTRSKIVRK